MKTLLAVPALVLALALSGCSSEAPAPVQPVALTDTAIGHYCGMVLLEHSGPKGQILLTGETEPVWFSSVRDTVAFTLLPEEPKTIAAIYVSDMGVAPSWDEPGSDNWIDAKAAYFVVDSAVRGGMGAMEAVPFSTADAAGAFVQENGGEVVRFSEIPADYILGAETAPPPAHDAGTPHAPASH